VDEPAAPAALGAAIEALRRGDADAALAIARRFVAAQPGAALGREVLAAALIAKKRWAEAERELGEALRLEPNRATAMIRLGFVALGTADAAKAEDWFRKALALAPGLTEARRGLALALLRQGRVQQAIAEAADGVQRSAGQDPEAKYLLAAVLHETGRPAQAEPLLDEVLAVRADYQPALLLQGIVKLELGKVDEAVPPLQRVIDRAPGSLWARLGLAAADRVKGRLAQSRAELEKLAAEQPEWALAHLQLGQTLWLQGEKEAARRAFEQAEKASPSPAFARLRVAQFFASVREVDRAVALARGVLGTPAGPAARVLLAQLYLGRGQLDLAQKELDAGAAELPQDPLWPIQLGRLHLLRGRPQEALAQFERAGQLAPASADALLGQAQAHAALNHPAEAVRAAQALVQAQKESADSYAVLGAIHERFGQRAEAVQAYEKALARQPAHLGAARGLALIYARQRRAQEAVRLLEAAAAAHPRIALPLLELGQIHQRLGDDAAAAAAYRRALALEPDNPVALNNLAYALGKDPAHLEEAVELAERAFRSAARSPAVADTLGWLLYQKGDLERAEALLAQAAAGAPDSAEIRYHLGIVYARRGKKDEARRELERALQTPGFSEADEARRALEALR
jgi:tetratricopeptide (TPR) repeat protein